MAALRSVSAALAGVLAAVLLPLGMVSSWVAGLATDTDRYVSTVAPLADDPVIRKAAIRVLDAQALKLIDIGTRSPALVRYLKSHGFTKLATSGGKVTDAVREEIEKSVRSAVRAGVEGPGFKPAWKAANRSAHREMVLILRDDDDALVDSDGRVTVELGTVLNTITASLQAEGLVPAGTVPGAKTSLTLLRTGDLEDARRGYRTLDALGFWLPVAWLVTFALAVLLSRRRIRSVRLVLFGSVLGIVAATIGIGWLGSRISDHSPDPDVATAVWDQVTSSLRVALLATSLVAAAIFTWLSTLVPNRIGQPPTRAAALTARIVAGVLVVLAIVMVVTG